MLISQKQTFNDQNKYQSSQFQQENIRAFGKDISNLESKQFDFQKRVNQPKSRTFISNRPNYNQQVFDENTTQICHLQNNLQIKQSNKMEALIDKTYQEQELFENMVNDLNNEIGNIESAQQNTQNVSQYVKEIFQYLQNTELKFICKHGYMQNQKDINENMRAILFDWLVDVQVKFKLLPETLYLTFNIIDRYLEKHQVPRKYLQLVGVSSLFTACKYEEIYPPQLENYVQITERSYSKREILQMESQILTTLEFNFGYTSCYRFFERYEQLAQLSEKQSYFCKYLLELCQLEYNMLKFPPSMIAASAIYLSNKLFQNPILWNALLRQNTKYEAVDLKSCAKEIRTVLQNAGKGNLTAIKRKYNDRKYMQISRLHLEKVKK